MSIETKAAHSVTDAMNTRLTVRDFLETPVEKSVLKRIFETARRTPSGGNLQPWNVHVLTGEKLNTFRSDVVAKMIQGKTEKNTYPAYPSPLWEPMRTWRYKVGEDMYALLSIPREDHKGRLRQVGKNFTFFGAPVGVLITVDKRMNAPQFMDVGIYLQSLMLLAREHGLHTAPQGAWRAFPDTIKAHTGHPDEQHILVGLAMGYANPEAPVNQLITDRAALEELVHFYD